jgi:competence protein ComEA
MREVRVAEAPWAQARTRPLRLELNTATPAELMALPGVDLALAQRVVAAREARGCFHSVEELAGVPGVSASLVRRLRAMRVDGAPPLPRR